jgi:5-methylcytosine-specific restriction protein A
MTVGNRRSEAAQGWRSWYWTPRWRAISAAQLKAQPFCCYCAKAGHQVRATVCDRVERHNGIPAKFWNGPFQSLCKPHHDASKQREEKRGFACDVGVDGWPVDPRHPGNSGHLTRMGAGGSKDAVWGHQHHAGAFPSLNSPKKGL